MEVYKYHIVYKTTNTINNKIYVGIHSTNNLEDSYLGSGWVLKDAIKKYGRDKFNRELLYVYTTRKEAIKMESIIVDKEFIKRKDTYNLALGGMGGVLDQWGSNNPMWGKTPKGAKKVIATHKDGTIVLANSIKELSKHINIARGNIRNLLKKQIVGKKGWKVQLQEDIVQSV
jgi:hypothetical protein